MIGCLSFGFVNTCYIFVTCMLIVQFFPSRFQFSIYHTSLILFLSCYLSHTLCLYLYLFSLYLPPVPQSRRQSPHFNALLAAAHRANAAASLCDARALAVTQFRRALQVWGRFSFDYFLDFFQFFLLFSVFWSGAHSSLSFSHRIFHLICHGLLNS